MPTSTPADRTTYIPDHAASGKLVVDFSRNPKDFKLAEYCQYIPTKKTEGRYVKMTVEQAGRIRNTNLADFLWPDSADAPKGFGNLETFSWESYVAKRYAFPFTVGELGVEQASWDVLAKHARDMAQLAITARTQAVITLATTSGNYDAAHTSAVSSISGVTGKWDVSTTARMDIKRSFDYAAETILKATLGKVRADQLMVVMSPGCAKKIATSQEMIDYIKQSPAAKELLTNTLSSANRFGMPEMFHGYKIVIEDAVKVTTKKGATTTKSYVLGDATPFMCSRVGELEGVENSPSFSSFSVFLKEEMTVESKHDRDNRRHEGRVVDHYAETFTAPSSAFLFTAAVD